MDKLPMIVKIIINSLVCVVAEMNFDLLADSNPLYPRTNGRRLRGTSRARRNF